MGTGSFKEHYRKTAFKLKKTTTNIHLRRKKTKTYTLQTRFFIYTQTYTLQTRKQKKQKNRQALHTRVTVTRETKFKETSVWCSDGRMPTASCSDGSRLEYLLFT